MRLLDLVLRYGSPLREALALMSDALAASLEVPFAWVSLGPGERPRLIGRSGAAVQGAASADESIVVYGLELGSVCVRDSGPRIWSAPELAALRAFADLAEYLIASRWSTQSELLDERAVEAARDQRQSAEIEGYRELAREQSAAEALSRRLQRALLPRLTAPDDLDVDIFYEPGSDRLLLGGDFTDTVIAADGGLSFVVGDVSGHGPEAAGLAISLRASWHALQSVETPLPRIAAELDRRAIDAEMHATVLFGRITADRAIAVVSAGHPPPIIARPGEAEELAGDAGPMLGLGLERPQWPATEHRLDGAAMLIYTDGLIEGLVGGTRERYGVERVLRSIADAGSEPKRLCREAAEANGGPLPDDVAILRIRPAAPPDRR